MNLLEKEVNNSKFDIKKYEHSKVCSILTQTIEKNFEGGVSKIISDLLYAIQNHEPKISNLNSSIKESMQIKPGEYTSPGSVSSKYQNIMSRNSIVSNTSSFLDDTLMDDIGNYINKDKVEIYQTVDDLIRIIEAQEYINQNKNLYQQDKYITPERKVRRGLEFLDISNIKINPTDASSSPFSHNQSDDDLTIINDSDELNKIQSKIQSIFFPNNNSMLNNIDDSIIEKIHYTCRKQ